MSRWRPPVKREPLGVTMRRHRSSLGAMIHDPAQRARFAADFPESNLPALPKPRIRRPVDGQPTARDLVPLEKEIQRAILDDLELDKRVAFVGRFNRGQAVAMGADGRTRYTAFNSVKGFPDIHGLLIGGRAFYIEVKRPPPCYEKPNDEQQAFLDNAKAAGACAGVATSVEEARALLT